MKQSFTDKLHNMSVKTRVIVFLSMTMPCLLAFSVSGLNPVVGVPSWFVFMAALVVAFFNKNTVVGQNNDFHKTTNQTIKFDDVGIHTPLQNASTSHPNSPQVDYVQTYNINNVMNDGNGMSPTSVIIYK